MGEKIIQECMVKFKNLQQISLDAEGKVVPPEQALSKHKKLSLKEYVLNEFRPKLEVQIYRSAETQEGMIKDLRKWVASKLDGTVQETEESIKLLQTDIDTTVKQELLNLNEQLANHQTEAAIVADEVSKIRALQEEREKEL